MNPSFFWKQIKKKIKVMLSLFLFPLRLAGENSEFKRVS